jgi:hypothetical protein
MLAHAYNSSTQKDKEFEVTWALRPSLKVKNRKKKRKFSLHCLLPIPNTVTSKVHANCGKQCGKTVAVASRVWFRTDQLLMLLTGLT